MRPVLKLSSGIKVLDSGVIALMGSPEMGLRPGMVAGELSLTVGVKNLGKYASLQSILSSVVIKTHQLMRLFGVKAQPQHIAVLKVHHVVLTLNLTNHGSPSILLIVRNLKDSKCNVSKYMSGRCGGTTRVAVLVGGLIAGALLMACLALLWYYVRRKSTSLRNQSSAKRLLCEAAGNSSVPFFQYKEIEKATNGFSEKQRIGRGCVDEIIDSYLDPNRDAWTLTSIHTVAELAFRCLAFHRDMRPTMTEVAEELEQIMLSAWIPTMYMASPSTSSCSSEYGSQKSLSGSIGSLAGIASGKVSIGSLAGIATGKLLPPQRTDSLTSL
ncbi:WALL-ASSOCIATED RECEPTOR KINASE-LIKE 14 [Salix viminalis]|uniref:WALL-ASSOCIATED RECEPTOR KINASE-LIKE 14 n=1 Tax=Salix viminalis TaxID=40686 RepID=A0A9Q0NZ36_SALVM|nr:WALL-ASSOCIATED RECEPTOR KINASE-LIKE 14 [Salix viminalis]